MLVLFVVVVGARELGARLVGVTPAAEASEGIRRSQKEPEAGQKGPMRHWKESEGGGRALKETEGIRRNRDAISRAEVEEAREAKVAELDAAV